MPVLSFQQALAQADEHRHLLLGNGFSIALRHDIFSYGALIERADLDSLPGARSAFAALGTNDFEAVIRAAVDSAQLVGVYDADAPVRQSLLNLAAGLKDRLVQAIAGSHPPLPADLSDQQYGACRTFLSNFKRKYTLNYDLLLYWVLLHDEVDNLNLDCDDGFRDSNWEVDADYVSWVDHHSATVIFLHGALHLFDAGHELIKYTWARTSRPLMTQIRAALEQERYPLFVAEGTSRDKFAKISHSAYLHRAYRSFAAIEGDLFIHGHSLKDNDAHILNAISAGRLRRIFVSLYGDPGSAMNREVQRSAQAIADNRRHRRSLDVYFYDAATANVWG